MKSDRCLLVQWPVKEEETKPRNYHQNKADLNLIQNIQSISIAYGRHGRANPGRFNHCHLILVNLNLNFICLDWIWLEFHQTFGGKSIEFSFKISKFHQIWSPISSFWLQFGWNSLKYLGEIGLIWAIFYILIKFETQFHHFDSNLVEIPSNIWGKSFWFYQISRFYPNFIKFATQFHWNFDEYFINPIALSISAKFQPNLTGN